MCQRKKWKRNPNQIIKTKINKGFKDKRKNKITSHKIGNRIDSKIRFKIKINIKIRIRIKMYKGTIREAIINIKTADKITQIIILIIIRKDMIDNKIEIKIQIPEIEMKIINKDKMIDRDNKEITEQMIQIMRRENNSEIKVGKIIIEITRIGIKDEVIQMSRIKITIRREIRKLIRKRRDFKPIQRGKGKPYQMKINSMLQT